MGKLSVLGLYLSVLVRVVEGTTEQLRIKYCLAVSVAEAQKPSGEKFNKR